MITKEEKSFLFSGKKNYEHILNISGISRLKQPRIKLLLKDERFTTDINFDKYAIMNSKIRNFIPRSDFVNLRFSPKLFKTSLNFRKMLVNCVNLVLIEENYVESVEISVVLTNDDKIRSYNRDFRNTDKSTDVLSFPMLGKNPDSDNLVLGDVVINIDAAVRQSIEYGHSLEREIAFLTIHSLFHLFGYDHKNPSEENVMREKQRRILKQMCLNRKEKKPDKHKVEQHEQE